VHNLALYIREPGSVWKAQGLTEPRDYVEKNRINPERAREFTRMLYELHQRLANEVAGVLDMTGVRRLMDVGGGSGVVSLALLRKYPDLTATVVDIENVCIAGREIAKENSLSDRITYQPVEFDDAEFPGGFDMILECDVSAHDEAFFRKLWASLNPGGRLVIVDHFSTTESLAHEADLEWSFLDSLEDPNFYHPTLAQVQARLVQAGFHLLPGEHTVYKDRAVIQAQKY
jgi:cyclopropane fatty-acyl-phospholipid synthase-like methyltransferase